jgi:uncharacterized protein YcbK (DUF882 family)
MDKDFLVKLEEARSFSNVPYKITSSWRSADHNRSIGASSSSSHLRGVAVDISALTSRDKYEIVTSLLKVFSRVGIGSKFVHADSDDSKAQNVIWTY